MLNNFIVVFIVNVVQCLLQQVNGYNSSYNVETFQPGTLGAEVCMDELGCFKMTKDFFDSEWRPINFLPEDRKVINTKFYLYTRQNPMESVILKHNDVDSLEEVDISNPTVIIVHGFLVNDNTYTHTKWMNDLKQQLLLSNDYNVIVVDWSGGNRFPYLIAAGNTRVVGAEIALLVESLIKHRNLDPRKVHIVGHSLGAHVSGYAGERIKNLGRITGLDPAGPFFRGMPPTIRLDPTDAEFVDVIHTDTVMHVLMALGMREPCGHIDFYPNGGQKQPGCAEEVAQSIFLDGLIDASQRFAICSHQRSVDYFIYSVNYKRALPVGFQCSSYLNFVLGLCSDCSNHGCAVMGMDADQFRPYKNDSNSVKMYLTTGGIAPYWTFTYQLQIKLSKTNNEELQSNQGSMNIIIKGTQTNYNVTTGPLEIVHGFTYAYLVHETNPLGNVQELTFTWTSNSYNRRTIYLENISLRPMNVASSRQQDLLTKIYCNDVTSPVDSNISINLLPC